MNENRKAVLMVVALFFGMCVSSSIIGMEETPSFDGDITIVSIQPPVQYVEKGKCFSVGIYVEPSEPIVGVNVDIYFDPTLIQAYSVRVGYLFDWPSVPGHPPGFDPGTIDNINGSITGICGAVITGEPVSDPGYFVNITFIAQQKFGTSLLDIQNVFIFDMDIYPLPITVIDGEVTVEEPPQITNIMLNTSDPLDTDFPFGWENISCNVTDNTEVHTVKVIITYLDDVTYPMTRIPNTDMYYFNTTFADSGYYKYYIWADDAEGNNATSSFQIFALPMNEDVDMDGCVTENDAFIPPPPHEGPPGWIREDVNNNGCLDLMDLVQIASHYGECWPGPLWLIPPEITNVDAQPNPQYEDGHVNITCDVTDNVAVDTVMVNITYPDASYSTSADEFVMSNVPDTDDYYYNAVYSETGDYNYFIWANDTSGNNATSDVYHFWICPKNPIPPEIASLTLTASDPLDTDAPYGWENISCTVTDNNGVDAVKLMVTNPVEEEYLMTNIPNTDTYYCNTTLTIAGCYGYYIWANDTFGNIAKSSPEQFELPPNWDVNIDGRPHLQDFVSVAKHYNKNGPPGWIREDVNNDGRVHLQDFVSIAKHYNERWERCS